MNLKQRVKETMAGIIPSFGDALAQARGELEKIRDEIEQTRIELEETERRPVSSAEAEARVDEAVKALAGHAKRQFSLGFFLGARPSSVSYLTEQRLHPLEAAALINPAALRACLLEMVRDAAATLPDGIGAADRQAEFAKLRARLQELERAEVERLWSLEDAGMPAPWRGDLPAAVVLGMEPIP